MSTSDEHVDLVGLVGCDLSNSDVALARTHLQTCAGCRDELADVVAGHALLTRSAATLSADAAPRRIRTLRSEDTLPPLQRPSGLRRARVPVLAAAAALALVAVLVGVFGPSGDDEPAAPTASVERSATFEPIEGDGTGTVSMTSAKGRPAHMVIEASGLPSLKSGEFYYAWLLDPVTNKMLPLGQVWPDGSSTFDIDDALIGSYSAIDVSLEQDDGDPQHSPTSVLRATYA